MSVTPCNFTLYCYISMVALYYIYLQETYTLNVYSLRQQKAVGGKIVQNERKSDNFWCRKRRRS